MQENEIEVVCAQTPAEWRAWLEKNHRSQRAVWLVFYNKKSGREWLTWSESVDVALCFGWIDSKKIKIDETRSHQFFSQRKPNGTWSKINKIKVEQLAEQGLMTEAGWACIEVAKQNGSWTILDEVEELIIPQDLETKLSEYLAAKDNFLNWSKSVRKMVLSWLVFAKTLETRQKRILEICESAELNLKPRHMR